MQQQQQQPSQDPQHNQDLEQPNQGLRHPNQGMQQRDQAWTPQQRTPAVRGSCVCTSNTCAMGSYKAAVLALGDDHEGVRILALQLLFVLAQGHPCLHLQEPHFWQFSRPQSMADDAFQRLCSAAANDPEMGVRRAALQWLQGLHGASLRVKLQALNKKAIVRAEVPAAGESAQPGKGQKKGKGRRQQGAVFTGRMGGGPWAGCPSTHSLDLLDASMGALVHGTEDELSQVRAATAGALAALGVSELLALGKMLRPAAGMRGGKDGRGGKRGADVDSDVLADRRQAACQSAEYLVDLLHDEVQVVREAAAQGLLQLARHARPTFLAAKQPRGSGAGVPDATPSLHNISGMDGKAAARLAVGVHGSSAGAGAEVQEQPQAHDAAGVSLLGRQTQAECLQNVAEAGAEAQEQPQAHDTADYADLFGGHVRTEVRPCDETTSGQATAPAPGADAVAAAGPLLAVLLDRDQTRSLISSLSDPSPLVRSCMRAALPFMCMSTPAVLQSLINALTQNALTFPDEAEEAKCVAKAAATCAPAHILGPALSKMLHQAQKQRQEQPHHQLQGNEQFLMIVQAMRDVLAVDRRET
uniref:Uncharacterized protein n=1 Tax=Dunaliella tertiolecta TaxID=3047 RepID=A0A7S3VR23_DUNTE